MAKPPIPRLAANASDGLLRSLRAVVLGAGYDSSAVEEARRLRLLVEPQHAMPAALRGEEAEALRTLVALLALGTPVPRMDAERALRPIAVDDLLVARLLSAQGGVVSSPFHVATHDGLILFGDHGEASAPRFVAAIFESARLLSRPTPREPRREMLDIATGSGIHALLAARHCDRVTGVDINPRALAFADLNARANGIENAEWRSGSWLEPVTDRRFDLIVCNPADVVSPDHDFAYRDNDVPGGAVIGELCLEVPQHLENDGLAVLFARWPHASRSDWEDAPNTWARTSGCDTIVIRTETVDLLDNAIAWNTPPVRSLDPTAFTETVTRWHRYHETIGARVLSSAIVVLRRRTGQTPWSLVTDGAGDPGRQAAQQIDRLIAGNDLLHSGVDLLSRRYSMPDGAVAGKQFARGERGWPAHTAVVTVPGELRLRGVIDADALEFLFRCDGRTPLADIVADAKDRAIATAAVAELLAKGLLQIA